MNRTKTIGKYSLACILLSLVMFGADFSCSKKDNESMHKYKEALVESPERAKEMVLAENMRLLRNAIEIFMAQEGHYPINLEELTDKGIIDHIPDDPFDGDYNYNPQTGKITAQSRPQL